MVMVMVMAMAMAMASKTSISTPSTPVYTKPLTYLRAPTPQLLSIQSARFSSRRLSSSSSSSHFQSRSSVVVRAASSDSANALDDVSIFTASGDSVMFKHLLGQNQEIAVVALLRHFGCPCCWELASALKDAKAKFDSADVKLIAVGVGTPEKARILAERLPFPMDCLYADPERKAYDVLGLYHGFGRTFFNPASAKVLSRFESLKQAVKNYTIEATPDDKSGVLQQGGMFVFKGNKLLYAHKDEGTGDHAPLDSILDICCSVPVA